MDGDGCSSVCTIEEPLPPVCGDGLAVTPEQCDDGNLLDGDGCSSDCTLEPARHFPATGQTRCWNTAGAVIACLDTGHDGEIQAGATLAYVDNGDGTITDTNTGLMWEKLSDDGTIHDWDNVYTWDDAFAVKVATLNGGGGFAGHRDWRLPNIKELQSIVNYRSFSPAVSAAFNTGCTPGCIATSCSCTQSFNYWSSSSNANIPSLAWSLIFYHGSDFIALKTDDLYVRAVRGGP
jgi:cysteine-rich repeat protein